MFAEASAAALAALALHQRVAMERWPENLALCVRAAVHSGEAELRDGDYHGRAVHLAGRLLAGVPAGRTVVSQATAELLAGRLPAGAVLFDLDAALPAAANATGGRLFGLVDREADRFVLEADRSGELGSERGVVAVHRCGGVDPAVAAVTGAVSGGDGPLPAGAG